MLSIIQTIAERKIQQAMQEQRIPDLSRWRNKPLPEDEDMSQVPEDLRLAYKLLKNAGYIPEELALRKELRQAEDLLHNAVEEQEKIRQLRRIGLLKTKIEAQSGRAIALGEEGPYYERVVERLSQPAG